MSPSLNKQYTAHDLRMRNIIKYRETLNEDRAVARMLYNSAEIDPKPHNQETFVKADTNKNMLSLIEPQFIIKLGEILTFGASKYSINNWQLCDDPRRYKDALLRHTYAYLSGEIIDPESGIEHTACIAFNTMALQWFDNQQKD